MVSRILTALTNGARDGWINIGAANQGNYDRLLQVLDAPEIANDPRFASNPERMRHREALVALITARLVEDITGNWVTRPLHGEHSLEILREFGFDQQRISELQDEGAILAKVG